MPCDRPEKTHCAVQALFKACECMETPFRAARFYLNREAHRQGYSDAVTLNDLTNHKEVMSMFREAKLVAEEEGE